MSDTPMHHHSSMLDKPLRKHSKTSGNQTNGTQAWGTSKVVTANWSVFLQLDGTVVESFEVAFF